MLMQLEIRLEALGVVKIIVTKPDNEKELKIICIEKGKNALFLMNRKRKKIKHNRHCRLM